MNKRTRTMIFSVVVRSALALMKYALAARSGSIALAADATHSLCDVVPPVVILACLFLSEKRTRRFPRGLHKVENLASLFVFAAGGKLLADGVAVLLDGNLDPATLKRSREIVLSQPSVARVLGIGGRHSGSYKILEVEVEIDAGDLVTAHAVSDELEESLRRGLPNVDQILIHYEPGSSPQGKVSVAPAAGRRRGRCRRRRKVSSQAVFRSDAAARGDHAPDAAAAVGFQGL